MPAENNRLLCDWLGIPATDSNYCATCDHSSRMHEEDWCGVGACDCSLWVAAKIYPDLASETGFWVLRKALLVKGYRVELDSDDRAYVFNDNNLAVGPGPVPHTALFRAAWALRTKMQEQMANEQATSRTEAK
jgi:hypothetical protein